MATQIDADKLIVYLEAWAEEMATLKSKWAIGWVVNVVREAILKPSKLDELPPAHKHLVSRQRPRSDD